MTNSWSTKAFGEAVQEMYKEFETGMMWGFPPDTRSDEQKYEDDIKIAYIFKDGERITLGVNNKDMKGYALGDWYSLKKPLEQVEYQSFERWYRGMDF